MKSIRKFIRRHETGLLCAWLMLLLAIAVCGICIAQTKNETDTQFVEAVKYGELDTGATLFKTNDGNLYAFRAHFAEQNGSRFLMEVRLNDPKDPTDDELIELWSTPSVSYDIDWAE